LRILEKGYKIQAVRVKSDAISVDTQQDLEFVRRKWLPIKLVLSIYKERRFDRV
jgi:CMP-2-keto-3-deoxyoctulosonic acid synthetase